MHSGAISEDVLQFIVRRIDSVPHLETLLLLWESPSTAWNEDQIAARVYVSRDHARSVLQGLARHGLIAETPESPGQYRYDQTWDEMRIMPTMAATYRQHLVHVASFIHAKSSSEAVKEFARAFKFKSDK